MDNPRLPYLHEKTLRLPMEPGVYIMHDKTGKVIIESFNSKVPGYEITLENVTSKKRK